MFEITTQITFEAAHQIAGHPKCGKLHGHSYRVEATLRATELPRGDFPFVEDFGNVKKCLDDLNLDHTYLNERLDLVPTAENIAAWIYSQIKPRLPKLYSITVWEGLKNRATYIGGE